MSWFKRTNVHDYQTHINLILEFVFTELNWIHNQDSKTVEAFLKLFVRFVGSVRFVVLTIKELNHHNNMKYFLQFMRSFLFILIFILCSNSKI